MKSFATVAAVAALATSILAATVVLKETPCLQETLLKEYTVQTGVLFVKDITSICGLTIQSVDPSSLQEAITCRAYKDAAGTDPGSAVFRWGVPALISTNPVQEGSILCEIDAGAGASSLIPRVTDMTTVGTETETERTMNTASMTVSTRTLVGTAVPTGEGGMRGNATVTMASPSATATGAAGAVRVGWGIGTLVVGVVGMII